RPGVELLFDLPLRNEFSFEVIKTETLGFKEVAFNKIGIDSEYLPDDLISNVRLRVAEAIEPDSSRGKLLRMHRQGRNEVTEDPLHSIDRNAPDSEKA